MKRNLMKKTIYLVVALTLVLSLVLTGCAGRKNVTVEEFAAVCDAHGFTLEDQTAQYNPELVTAVWVHSSDTSSLGYYTFIDPTDAKTRYAQLFSSLSTGVDGEKYIDSAEYNRFYACNEGGLALLYRNGTTMLFLAGDDVEALEAIIDELGI